MKKSIIVLLFITAASHAHADKASRANSKGIETYKNGDYQESVRHFTDALVERPESPVLRFNRGTALAAEKNHEEAASELLSAEKSMKTPDGSAAAMYNAANSLAAGNSLEDAVTLYKQGVKLDQQSEDIRHNLELVMRKMQDKDQQEQKQQQDQQDEQNKDQDSQDKDNKDKQDDKDKKEQDKQQQDQNNKTDQQNKDQQQDQQQQESQQEQSDKQPMSPEEAKRLLDALNDEEKKSLSMRYQKMMREMRQGDDW